MELTIWGNIRLKRIHELVKKLIKKKIAEKSKNTKGKSTKGKSTKGKKKLVEEWNSDDDSDAMDDDYS